MSQFSQITGQAAEVMHHVHADASALIYSWGGTSVTVDAVVHDEGQEVEIIDGQRLVRFVRRVTVRSSDIATPVVDATAVVEGRTYHVEPEELGDHHHVLKLTRVQANEVTRPGYRGGRR